MIEKIKGVRNPLTIIAIFAGLAEISGTVVLPLMEKEIQGIYVWFLICFPALLVLLFFATLNFNPKVLYSPSDFRNEENYMKIFQPGSETQKILKIQEEVNETAEAEEESEGPSVGDAAPRTIVGGPSWPKWLARDAMSRYRLAESLVIDRLAKELKTAPRTNVVLQTTSPGRKSIFDAVFDMPDGLIIVEIKVTTLSLPANRIRRFQEQVWQPVSQLPDEVRRKTRVILAIVCDNMEDETVDAMKSNLHQPSLFSSSIETEIRFYTLRELLKDLVVEEGHYSNRSFR